MIVRLCVYCTHTSQDSADNGTHPRISRGYSSSCSRDCKPTAKCRHARTALSYYCCLPEPDARMSWLKAKEWGMKSFNRLFVPPPPPSEDTVFMIRHHMIVDNRNHVYRH